MRAQAAALYREYADREREFTEKQKASRAEAEELRGERDALAIRARRLEEVLDVEERAADDPSAPHRWVTPPVYGLCGYPLCVDSPGTPCVRTLCIHAAYGLCW